MYKNSFSQCKGVVNGSNYLALCRKHQVLTYALLPSNKHQVLTNAIFPLK
jgi:hypothetical protein